MMGERQVLHKAIISTWEVGEDERKKEALLIYAIDAQNSCEFTTIDEHRPFANEEARRSANLAIASFVKPSMGFRRLVGRRLRAPLPGCSTGWRTGHVLGSRRASRSNFPPPGDPHRSRDHQVPLASLATDVEGIYSFVSAVMALRPGPYRP